MMLRPYPKSVNKFTISQILYILVQDCDSRVFCSAKPDSLEVRMWQNKIRFSQLMDLKFREVWATKILIESSHDGFGAPCFKGNF